MELRVQWDECSNNNKKSANHYIGIVSIGIGVIIAPADLGLGGFLLLNGVALLNYKSRKSVPTLERHQHKFN